MAATPDQQPWSFDVSSLMVLVSEGEEESYRLSQRSFLQCLVMTPVVGLQNYVRSYEFLLDAAKLDYFSPDGVKSAPLRYMRLSNAIKHKELLKDSGYTVYRIPNRFQHQNATSRAGAWKYHIRITLWVLFTWFMFAGVLVFTIMVPNTTWVGITNCAAFTGWSIILRLIEKVNIRLARINDAKITLPAEPDAVYILGRTNSAFVLEGTRKDVKYWTARGLCYQKSAMGVPDWAWQYFTRLGSMLMLLFIFSCPACEFQGHALPNCLYVFLEKAKGKFRRRKDQQEEVNNRLEEDDQLRKEVDRLRGKKQKEREVSEKNNQD